MSLDGLPLVLELDDDVGGIAETGRLEVLGRVLPDGPERVRLRPDDQCHIRKVLARVVLHGDVCIGRCPELEPRRDAVPAYPHKEHHQHKNQVLFLHRHSLSPKGRATLQASQYTELRDRVNPNMNSRFTVPSHEGIQLASFVDQDLPCRLLAQKLETRPFPAVPSAPVRTMPEFAVGLATSARTC